MEKPEEQPEIELEEESSDDESSISIVDDESPKEQPEIELEEESKLRLRTKAEEEKKDLKVPDIDRTQRTRK